MCTEATSVWNGMFPEIRIDRAELADRAGEGERHAREDRGHQVRQHDPAEDREAARAERGGGLLHVAVELEQHRLDRAHHERQRHEEERERRPPTRV